MKVKDLIYTLNDMMDLGDITEDSEISIKIPYLNFDQEDFIIEPIGDGLSIIPELQELD